MKHSSLTIIALAALMAAAGQLQAQDKPVVKLDFNEASRKDAEVLEPGYTAWPVGKSTLSDTKEFEGVSFTLTSESGVRASWSKALVQAAENNSRFTMDGIVMEADKQAGEFSFTLKGLPAGVHTLQTYHNDWNDPDQFCSLPIHVCLNGNEVAKVNRTWRQTSIGDVASTMISFVVSSADDETVIRFYTTEDDDYDNDPDGSKTKCCGHPILNGMELNTIQSSAKSKKPSPADADYHIDADNGSFVLSWSPAGSSVAKHHLYFGTDQAAVTAATTASEGIYQGTKDYADTTWTATDLYNLNTYYWRVDEEDTLGTVTPGDVWSFRPRHLAFPDAEGYGRFATGGRGGDVYHVTNLNASGEGSFAYGIQTADGPRTIVFDVSGLIVLGGRLTCSAEYVTVAGQTAPGHGICLADNPFGVGDEGISRFLRLRLGLGEIIDEEGHRRTADGIGMAGADHSILDHASISWTIDESFSSRNAHNMTLQRTMIAEALGIAGHKNYTVGKNHGFAATIGGDVGSFHHNLLAHCNGRNWSLGGGLDGNGYYAGRLDIFNNVVYNWGGRATDGGAHEVNFVGNFYKMGPASNTTTMLLNAQLEGTGKGSQAYYVSGNVRQARSNGALTYDKEGDTYKYSLYESQVLDWDVWVSEPFFPSYATVQTAVDAYKSVVSDVGATQPFFDVHDQRIVDETINASYTYTGSLSKIKGQIDDQADCGGYEVYPEVHRDGSYDTDGDGMPDWYEALTGCNASVADNNADPDHDGYTCLEDYLEWIAHTNLQLAPGQADTIDIAVLFKGYTKSPVYTIDGTWGYKAGESGMVAVQDKQQETAAQAQLQGSKLLLAAGQQTGLASFTLKVTDGEGASYRRLVNVAVTDAQTQPVDALSRLENARLVHYTAFDLNGRCLQQADVEGCDMYSLPLGGLSAGAYVIKAIDAEGQSHSFKIVKN